jgi:hypothetical protein
LQSAASLIDTQFPPDPPRVTCRYAVITGIAVTNSTWISHDEPVLPAGGDFVEFFHFGGESIHIWIHETYEPSLLVAEVAPNKVHVGVWRTSAAALSLVNEFTSMQEHRSDTGYSWMYNSIPRVRSMIKNTSRKVMPVCWGRDLMDVLQPSGGRADRVKRPR